jgi:hypothetical protein
LLSKFLSSHPPAHPRVDNNKNNKNNNNVAMHQLSPPRPPDLIPLAEGWRQLEVFLSIKGIDLDDLGQVGVV